MPLRRTWNGPAAEFPEGRPAGGWSSKPAIHPYPHPTPEGVAGNPAAGSGSNGGLQQTKPVWRSCPGEANPWAFRSRTTERLWERQRLKPGSGGQGVMTTSELPEQPTRRRASDANAGAMPATSPTATPTSVLTTGHTSVNEGNGAPRVNGTTPATPNVDAVAASECKLASVELAVGDLDTSDLERTCGG